MRSPMPTPEMLISLLKYDPESGNLYWRERPVDAHPNNIRWNGRYAGKKAGNPNARGYLKFKLLGRQMSAHRVAWAIYHGEWPSDEIDHINGTISDNRIENLRCVSRSENTKNLPLQSNNMSGVPGVCWREKSRKWHAVINQNRKQIHIGLFDRKSDAVMARKAAEKRLGFHENHGRQA